MASPNHDPSAAPFFEVADLSFSYASGSEALRGVSFKIARGEMAGLIGPNGAGKSTLLHLMNGLLRPSAGCVRLEGEEIARMDPRRRARRVAYVPQSPRVFFPYTALEIVAMGRHPYVSPFSGLTGGDWDHVHSAMEATGTAAFAARRFNELSGGEAQRVVIARALAQDAPALILDEPTAALDLYYQAAVYGLLDGLNRGRGLTVLIVTHDVNLAAEYCPRLIGLREGRILMDGPVDRIVTAEAIDRLYGVDAEILIQGSARAVRVRRAAAHR